MWTWYYKRTKSSWSHDADAHTMREVLYIWAVTYHRGQRYCITASDIAQAWCHPYHPPHVYCFFSSVWHQISPYDYHNLDHSYRLRNSDVCDARHDASCYAIVSEKLNWQSARSRCESGGGHLATIANQAENDVIKSMATSKIYIKYRTMCVELSILVALKLCLICGIPVRK